MSCALCFFSLDRRGGVVGLGYLMYESSYMGFMWLIPARCIHCIPHQEGFTKENVPYGQRVGI